MLDARARSTARAAAEAAEDLAARGEFSAALERVKRASEALPEPAPWTRTQGLQQLGLLTEQTAARREQTLAAQLTEVEANLRAGQLAAARAAIASLERHPEAEFRAAGKRAAQAIHEAVAARAH